MMLANLVPIGQLALGLGGLISQRKNRGMVGENPDEADSRGSGHRYSSFQIFTEWFHRLLAGALWAHWWS